MFLLDKPKADEPFNAEIYLSGPTLSTAAMTEESKQPQMAVYRWAMKPANIDAFGRWIGRPDVWGEDFTNSESWDNIENPGWLFEPWARWLRERPGRRWIMGVPMLVGAWDLSGPKQGQIDKGIPVSLEKGAAGEYDRHYEQLARNLVSHGLGDAILRPGWEFNGGWYTWRAQGKPEAFAQYWRRIVKVMRTVKGAEHLQFCWNPALGYLGFPADKAWPGDEFVDLVGIDVYDTSYLPDTFPWSPGASASDIEARRTKVWDRVIFGGDHGLAFWSKFAAEHHKPLCLPEWGVDDRTDGHGGLDDPAFIQRMHGFITDPNNHVAFHCYFDVQAPDGGHQLSPGEGGTQPTKYPQSAAKFKGLFGGSGKK
jgi:hypothetical protein